MSDSTSISGPVEIQSEAKARVAFDLMDHISRREKITDQQKESRAYWLTLYRQCYKAADGEALAHILEQK